MQGNLNTNNTSSFYENLPAAEAFALGQRFEFNYTPKSASWFNIIEIEFSAIARQCMKRCIPAKERLEKEVLAIIKERSDKQIKINWQFSLEVARNKNNTHPFPGTVRKNAKTLLTGSDPQPPSSPESRALVGAISQPSAAPSC